jgi:hypothetical protein
MNTEQNKALVRNFLNELDKGIDAVDRFFSPDCLAYLPGTASPTDTEGLKSFYRYASCRLSRFTAHYY